MSFSKVTKGLNFHHLALESLRPENLARFYSSSLKMEAVKISDSEWRCEGPHRKLIFRLGQTNKLAFAGMSFENLSSLLKFKTRLKNSKVKTIKNPSPYFCDQSFAVKDPDGNIVTFGLVKLSDNTVNTKAPLQHLTFASMNVERFQNFYHDKLGFQITDRVLHKDGSIATCFLTSNHEHHTVACFKSDRIGIDHHSYETGKWNYIRDWCDHFAGLGIRILWGPGRHGPGNNLFVFIKDPDNNWIELSAELELAGQRDFKDWPQEEKTLNLWGEAIMRS